MLGIYFYCMSHYVNFNACFFAETFQPMNAALTFQIGLNDSARAIRGKFTFAGPVNQDLPYDDPVGFVNPPCHLMQFIALFAVAEGLICLFPVFQNRMGRPRQFWYIRSDWCSSVPRRRSAHDHQPHCHSDWINQWNQLWPAANARTNGTYWI